MQRISKTILLTSIVFVSAINLNKTLAYYNTNTNISDKFYTEKYEFSIDGTGGLFKEETIVVEKNKVSLPSPKRTGYDFIGFSSSNNGDVEYTNDVSNIEKINNKKIYAKWDIINYSINYNLNGGSISNPKTSYNVEENFVLPIPEKRGYDFIGWSGSDLISTTQNVIISKGSVGNRDYTANWNVKNYSISYNLNGGSISNPKASYNVEETFTLPIPTKIGYDFVGWTSSDISVPVYNLTINNSTGDKSYTANWQIKKYFVDINSIIQNNAYNAGLEGFTFSVWINGIQVADHAIDYYNGVVDYGSSVRVYVYDRLGYNVTSFRDNTWIITDNTIINPSWYDNIPPTITSFSVTNLGYYIPNVGASAGWNIRIYIDAYDEGVGIQKYQTWLVPYRSGSGAAREDGNDRTLMGVLYLNEPSGRTFCAYAIDNAGNEAERCETIRVN